MHIDDMRKRVYIMDFESQDGALKPDSFQDAQPMKTNKCISDVVSGLEWTDEIGWKANQDGVSKVQSVTNHGDHQF